MSFQTFSIFCLSSVDIVTICISIGSLIVSVAAFLFSIKERRDRDRAEIFDKLVLDVANLQAQMSNLEDWDGNPATKPCFDTKESNLIALEHLGQAKAFCLFRRYYHLFRWINLDKNGFAYMFGHYIDDFGRFQATISAQLEEGSDNFNRVEGMRLELYELENALGKKVAKASSSCKFIMNVSDLSKQRGGK